LDEELLVSPDAADIETSPKTSMARTIKPDKSTERELSDWPFQTARETLTTTAKTTRKSRITRKVVICAPRENGWILHPREELHRKVGVKKF
jgi:hypothetical protein